MGRGKHTWVPNIVIEELDMISKESDIPTQSVAFREMVRYSRIGRQANKKVLKNLFGDLFDR